MPLLTVLLDLNESRFDALAGIADDAVVHLAAETRLEVGALPNGMTSGKPSVAFCFPLPDGRVVVAETSLALFLSTADVTRARYGDPR